jgi:hypothetical protein
MEYPIVGTFVEQASIHSNWFSEHDHIHRSTREPRFVAGGTHAP